MGARLIDVQVHLAKLFRDAVRVGVFPHMPHKV